MTRHVPTKSLGVVSRRQVMIGAAGLSFAFALRAPGAIAASLADVPAGKALSPWVSIRLTGPSRSCRLRPRWGRGR